MRNFVHRLEKDPSTIAPLIPTALGRYQVNRPAYSCEQFSEISGYEITSDQTGISKALRKAKQCRPWSVITSVIPVLDWLPKYSLKENLVGDSIAGLTVAVMHIPQGMAYAMLAGVPPTVGLYMAFFPTLAYVIFGTSRHLSMGTFALISIMVGKIVRDHAVILAEDLTIYNGTTISTTLAPNISDATPLYTPVEVATAVSFMSGIYLLAMCLFRMGAVSALLSEPLVNGFSTGAAVAVFVSQLKDLFGLKIVRHSGLFSIVYNIYETCKAMPQANVYTIIISSVIMLFMVINNELIKPRMSKISRFPIPAELICVVGATLASKYMELGTTRNIILVGSIPTGLPAPVMPPVALLRAVALDSIAVMIVSYSIVMSLGKMFGRKHQYEIRANQELLAMGIANIVGAFFSCLPISCSLSRTLIQATIGGKTQVTSIISASLILIVLLWIGPFFEVLPKCVLAAIILVALKGFLMQGKDFFKFWKQGAPQVITWLGACFGAIIISIDIGLMIGIALSIGVLMIGSRSNSSLLGVVPETAIYADMCQHKLAEEVPGIRILHYCGSITFATAAGFKNDLFKLIGVSHNKKMRRSNDANEESGALQGLQTLKYIIIDMSAVSYIDAEGTNTLRQIRRDLNVVNITTVIAQASDTIMETIRHLEQLGEAAYTTFIPMEPVLAFPTIHDAVVHLQTLIGQDPSEI